MFPNDAHSQPASLRTMPVAPIHVTGCTVQSVYSANGRGVVKRSAAALGKLNQVSSCTSALTLRLASCELSRCCRLSGLPAQRVSGCFLAHPSRPPEYNPELHTLLGGPAVCSSVSDWCCLLKGGLIRVR